MIWKPASLIQSGDLTTRSRLDIIMRPCMTRQLRVPRRKSMQRSVPRWMLCVILVAVNCHCYADEICLGEVFEPSCNSGEVIAVTSARYGRMQVGRCISRDYGQLGCNKDILSVADQLCSGRTECSVPVNVGTQVADGNPCDKDWSSYMDADYRCLRVVQGQPRCNTVNEIKVSGQRGIISSHVTHTTSCGNLATPWVIEASPGQRINLSLVDFGWTTRDTGELQPLSQCDVYGYISERRLGMNKTLCGGLARERHVYYSASSSIEIQISPLGSSPQISFLLQYQVTGCPDVTPPDHAWYKRNGSTAVIGCEWSEHSWHLKCEGNSWVGVVGNCSGQVVGKPAEKDKLFSLPPVMTIGLIVGLGVLVITLLCILIIGYLCCRRKPNRMQQDVVSKTIDQGYEGQAFLYYPGRPVPIQGHHTLQGQPPPGWGQLQPGQNKPNTTDELLHIWETPLPEPMTNPQDDSGVVSEPTYASLPSRGNMPAPCPSHDTEPRVAVNDGVKAGDVTWPGTRAFYEQDKGWVDLAGNN